MKIKDKITPYNWIQGGLAQDSSGNEVDIDDEKACRFCLVGWIVHCYSLGERNTIYDLVAKHLQVGIGGVAKWNDCFDTGFNDVIELVNRLDI